MARKGWLFILPWDVRGDAGGVNQVVKQLVANLGPGYTPVLLCYETVRETATYDGAVVEYRPRIGLAAGASLWTRARFLLRHGLEAVALLRLLRAHDVAVVNVHFPTVGTAVIATLKKLRLFSGPLLVSFHGSDINAMSSHPYWFNAVLSAADHIVACSEAIKRRLVAFNAAASRSVVIYNGMDPADFPPVDVARRPGLIVCAASFERVKGLDVLLRAAARLRSESWRLVIVGRMRLPDYVAELEALAEELGIRARVRFVEAIPHAELAGYYAEADCFVLSSRSEGMPLVVLEAGYFGAPVVASRVGGIPEIIPDDSFGTLVPPEDAEALAKAIDETLAAPDLARSRAAKLRARILAEFQVKNTAAAYRSLVGPALQPLEC